MPMQQSVGTAVLGIDLGTSSCKAAIVDVDTGRVVAQASSDYPVMSLRPGQAETDPRAWWDAVAVCVCEVVRAAHVAPVAIGLSGQMHGLVLCDDDLAPVRAALLWADSRAVAELDRYHALTAAARDRLANPITPGMAGPLLLWVAAHEPDAYGAARWALSPKDWLRTQLTGQVAAEPSDASATLLYDVPGDGWDLELLDTLELRESLLAPLLGCAGDPAGTLTAAAASLLGLPAGIPVAAGAADTAAAALGSGVAHPDQIQLTVGTGAQILRPLDAPVDRAALGVHLYRTAARTGWYHMAASTNAGIALSWVRDALNASWQELYGSLASPIHLDDPLFIPHLTGERTPYLNPALRGSWTGLALGHDRTILLRTALEGVAYATVEAYQALLGQDPHDTVTAAGGLSADATMASGAASGAVLRIAGGGSVDPQWRQLLADLTASPLYAVDTAAASARGAALLGAQAAGLISDEDITGPLAPALTLVARPDAARHGLLTERLHRFHEQVLRLADVPTAPADVPTVSARTSTPFGGRTA